MFILSTDEYNIGKKKNDNHIISSINDIPQDLSRLTKRVPEITNVVVITVA